MLLGTTQVAAALDAIAESMGRADGAFDDFVDSGTNDDWAKESATWNLEVAYSQLITLAEALQLPLLRADIVQDLKQAQKEGLAAIVADLDAEPHQKWGGPARKYLATLQSTFGSEAARTVTKDLESIIRSATYSITDAKVFATPPEDEREVHLRLESVLRCVFPDLLHKPRLAKPIKNFEPDTGIPSIHTLIEYKFLDRADSARQIADELLADTRGYTSHDWTSFLYVIYETKRFKPESQWRQLFRDCDIDSRTLIIVISGEPVERGSGRHRSKTGLVLPHKRLRAKAYRNRGREH